jgi:hypothetical protein
LNEAAISFRKKLDSGELSAFARVKSSDGAHAQIDIASMSLSRDGFTSDLIEEHISLSTNAQVGDITNKSAAIISFPLNSLNEGIIQTSGNASVSNNPKPIMLQICGGSDQIKVKSANGLFVIARLRLQRNTGFQYFDILFGTANRRETLNASGAKQRPHLSFYPDGNGKFIRLADYKCELETMQKYNAQQKQIIPSSIRIRSLEHMEIIELNFESSDSAIVNLKEIRFESSI